MAERWKRISTRFSSRSKGKLQRAAACVIEPLESRLQLSASLTLNGTQTITPGTVQDVSNTPALSTDTTSSSEHEFEMSVAVNPKNPLNVVGVSVRRDTNDFQWDIDVYRSTDGGATWAAPNRVDTIVDPVHSEGIDPSIAFDADGKLYISYIHSDSAALVVLKSEDEGATFDVILNRGIGDNLDKDLLTTGLDGSDPTSGNQAVYVTYTTSSGQYVIGSNDGGANFTSAVSVGGGGSFLQPAVGPNGELYIAYIQSAVVGGRFLTGPQIARDLDGLWGTGHQFHDISDIRPFAYSSVDTDFDYSTPIVPDRGAINAPVIDVDRKSGRIYVAFVERDDTTTNVRVVSSTDNGATWGSPVTGLPVTVDDTSGSTDILPWLAVDQTTGSVNVMYYTDAGTDIDPATGTHPLSKPRLATSIDQGATFIHADVSSATSDERGASALDYGEYLGLAVHDGTAQALWARGVSGLNDSYSTSVSFQSGTSGNVLTINGDDSGSPTADTILVRRNATNSAFIEVIVNGVQQFCGLYGTVNSIVINGFGGNDTIAIDSGVSLPGVINGGDGNDSITGGTGNDTIDGGAGSDTITGGASGNDSLLGGDGNDTIDGGSGLGYNNNNTINGGAGNDSLVGGNGDDVIAGGSGADTMKGLAGNDTLDYSASAIAISVNLFNNAPQGPEGDAVTGFENVDGSAFNDTITGDDSGNALNGNGGDDVITGGMTSNNGGDTIDGGSGNDTISVATGTNGGSSLLGSDGNDSITGGTGDDTIDGGAGNDSLYGGAGNDILTGGTGQDYLSGGDGDDAFATGDSEIDTIYGGNGHDSILDKDSNDVLFDNVPD